MAARDGDKDDGQVDEETELTSGKYVVNDNTDSLERGHRSNAQVIVERTRKQFEAKHPKWIIFPTNKWIRWWDGLMLWALFILSFSLPYQIGVSGGYYLIVNDAWFAVTLFMNGIFFVDTFLYFFRSFYDKRGHLQLDLRQIQRRYLRGKFLLNLISCFPSTLIFTVYTRHITDLSMVTEMGQEWLILLKIIEVLKFARLARANDILKHSELAMNIRSRIKSSYLQLLWFLFVLTLVSHWLACFWVFVALCEAGGFGDALGNSDNWISSWDASNTSGINPIGWENSFDRYVLALFWSIQTLTSIGYGTLSPYTPVEWWIASILMLLAGLCWAYVVGSTVNIAASLQAEDEAFRTRMDAANHLISHFPQKRRSILPAGSLGAHMNKVLTTEETKWDKNSALAERIRDYIRIKSLRGNGSHDSSRSTMDETYSILGMLPPELRAGAALALMEDSICVVPYLRREYMHLSALMEAATSCQLVDFSPGESLCIYSSQTSDLERGIYIMRLGSALRAHYDSTGRRVSALRTLTTDSTIGAGQVLLESTHPARVPLTSVGFLTYTEMVFLSREVVMSMLKTSPEAWKFHGRWIYLREGLQALGRGMLDLNGAST